MKILFLLHAPFELPGLIEDWAAAKGFELSYCSPYAGEELPRNPSFDLIVSMGGPQSAISHLYTHPYLNHEVNFIRSALQTKIPVLGFCLGAQLLGVALGAPTTHSPHKEIGVHPITLTKDGVADPILKGLPQSFLVPHWHGDMPGLTKQAVVLAKSEGCPRQIIRYLPYAYGFQCHPEMTEQTVRGMIKNCPDDFTNDKYVQTPEHILSHDFHALNHANMTRILDNFLHCLGVTLTLPSLLNHTPERGL